MSASGYIDLPPYWRIVRAATPAPIDSPFAGTVVKLMDGPGFGRGDHETTQLCLLALGYLLRQHARRLDDECAGAQTERPPGVLDFGAGSGILAVAAALRGARVQAVEVDLGAIEHARDNARANGVEAAVEFSTHLPEPPSQFDVVLANILCRVLIDHADALCSRIASGGSLVLSGLVATDVPSIIARYGALRGGAKPTVVERGAWRAVLFSG